MQNVELVRGVARLGPWSCLIHSLPPLNLSTYFHVKRSVHKRRTIIQRLNNPLKVVETVSATVRRSATAATSTSSPSRYPKYQRLLPCPSEVWEPRVEHLVADKRGNVVEIVSEKLDLPSMYVEDLIHFGAIHCALVCPPPPPTATIEQIELFKKITSPSALQKRRSLKGKTIREAQKTFRITDTGDFIESGSYLRVHVHPKRFPRCHEVDWRSRVIAETESYVVLNKPVGTSIRAQFADIGAPVVGDSVYMPAAIKRMESPSIYPFGEVDTTGEGDKQRLNDAIDRWILQHGKEPSLAIGLQASEIVWDNYEYKAGPPWWRSDREICASRKVS